MSKLLTSLLFVAFVAVGSALAQAPTGTITGTLTDATGAVVAGARITITNRATGLSRHLVTSVEGDYSAAALPPGDYQVTGEATGFSLLESAATVEAGTTTTVNLSIQVGGIIANIAVSNVAPLIRYDHHHVGGLVNRNQIENLPLNGRNFLELAKLEPGVQPPTRASSNRTFVPALGQPMGNNGRGTRVTVDGGSIMAVGVGGSAMGFSQEVVQEFQVSTVNFDLATGITNGAAINVATRSGGNELHGTGFYFFRDHTIAAYPALSRDSADPDPFFQRRQFGFAIGGPISRDRVFFFGNYERNEQRAVVATTLLEPEFAHLSRITPSPLFGNQLSVRLDGRLSNAHTAFIRYSHDGSRAFLPTTNRLNDYPSAWVRSLGWSDQSILGLTSLLGNTLVNDFRFSYFFVSSSQVKPTEQDCPGCVGIGAPSIAVPQVDLFIGSSVNQRTLARRYHLNDYVTWLRSAHRVRFGVDWEYNRGGVLGRSDDAVTLTLFSPLLASRAGIPVPSAFRTLEDILELPLQRVTVAIGDARVPQADGGMVRNWNTLRLFIQDTWRLNSRLTVNYGLGWSVDRNLNYDLTKPALLAPILGEDGLGPTRKQWKNFSPVLGLAWAPSSDGKTVIRAGAGLFYDFSINPNLEVERTLLGPTGLGRQEARVLNFSTATRFTGANFLTSLPVIRAELIRALAPADRTIQAIQLTKEASGLNPVDVPIPTALHINVGIQREIARDFVVSADFAYRRFDHVGLGQIDLNHFDSARGPVIPECESDAQRNDPQALCSRGEINVQTNAGRVTYTGLLARADKRFSRGFQLLGSWAYSSNAGTNIGPGFNLDDWLSNRGPHDYDITHIVNLAGVVQLPWRFQLGFNFSYASAPPLSAFVGGNDFNGDGTTNDLLPGTTVNALNRGLERSELERLVAQFNQTHGGKLDGQDALIPSLTLPEQYWFGDNFHSLDLRLSREFVFQERWRLILIGEAFNLYNAANLSGHSGNLTNADTFGQPTRRVDQVFGSGGPRAFQLAARISF